MKKHLFKRFQICVWSQKIPCHTKIMKQRYFKPISPTSVFFSFVPKALNKSLIINTIESAHRV